MTAEQRTETAKRLLPTIVTQLRAIREMGGGIDPRPTIKSRYDTLPTPTEAGRQTTALNTILGTDRTLLTPEEFNDMVNYAYTQL